MPSVIISNKTPPAQHGGIAEVLSVKHRQQEVGELASGAGEAPSRHGVPATSNQG
jgi:hypothetical protein